MTAFHISLNRTLDALHDYALRALHVECGSKHFFNFFIKEF